MAIRFRWVPDDDYQSEGSYAYDTEAETAAAVAAEIDGLNSGELEGPYGCIAEHDCPTCGHSHEFASVWGIVLAAGDTAYRAEIESDLAGELR
jgi:hypothetical protein